MGLGWASWVLALLMRAQSGQLSGLVFFVIGFGTNVLPAKRRLLAKAVPKAAAKAVPKAAATKAAAAASTEPAHLCVLE
jgi:hypothetical protein